MSLTQKNVKRATSKSEKAGQTANEKKEVSFIDKETSQIDIYREPIYNPDGSRNMAIPFSLFIIRKTELERENNKKIVKVSNPSAKDREIFKRALMKLKCQKQSKMASQVELLKNLAKARGQGDENNGRKSRQKSREGEKRCTMACTLVVREKSRSRSRSEGKKKGDEYSDDQKLKSKSKFRPYIRLPPIKTKPWIPPTCPAEARLGGMKKKPKPIVVIPPFKTCKWVPQPQIKPKKKVQIQYPPLTKRSKPWKPKSNKKKLPKRVRLDKIFYPIPVTTKIAKTWNNFKCLSNYQILHGITSQYSKKFNFITNGKQSTFIAATALAFAQFSSVTKWKSQHLDEIILYGDINCRRQIRKFRHQSIIKPCDIEKNVYLRRAKVLIELCEKIERGVFEPNDMNLMRNQIEEVIKFSKSLIITYCGQSYAIWSFENSFFIFNSEDTNESGKLIERARGGCCAIRSTSLATIIDYLTSNFRMTKQKYEICSFRVEKVITLEEELSKLCPKKENVEKTSIIDEPEKKEVEIPIKQEPQSSLATILFRQQPEPIFGDSFQKSSTSTHGFLTCSTFLSSRDSNRAPFISTVAILTLRICKSSLWMPSTMLKIFDLGHTAFNENVLNYFKRLEERRLELAKVMEPESEPQKLPGEEGEDDDEEEEEDENSPAYIRKMRRARLAKPKREPKEKEEIPITELPRFIVELHGKRKLEVKVEMVVVGKVLTRKPDEISLQLGLENFFKKFDQGFIDGPDIVAIWREQNYFFLFDPNHCQQFKRSELPAKTGNSCLNWFKNLTDLVQHYINNLKKEQRTSVFKICKVESREFVEIANNWHYFKAIESSKWILAGNISESSEEFKVSNRGHQSTCISLIAIAKAHQLGIISWNSQIIDDIIRLGDEFYSGCLLHLKEKKELNDPNLALNEIGTEFSMENYIIDFSIEESVVIGKLMANEEDSYISLDRGLQLFFSNDDYGIVIAAGISLAIFQYDNAFFLFDGHARDEIGRNLKTLDPVSSCLISGTACLLRFLTIDDLSSHMLSNFEIGNATMFSINKVDVSLRSTKTPCLYHYSQFGNENAAILRAYGDWHEDIEQFKTELDQKTICNLFACLCYSKILNPQLWTNLDINAILKNGYKLLCYAVNDLDNVWEKLSCVEIYSVRMRSKKKNGILGIFERSMKILPDIDIANETIEENVQISEIEKRGSQQSDGSIKLDEIENQTKKTYVDNDDDDDNLSNKTRSSIFPPIESASDASKIPLIDILNSWNDKKEVLAILISSLYSVTIIKMNHLYFIFDPKASSSVGMLTEKRYDDFIKRHLKEDYQKLLERFQQPGNVQKRMSKEEEFEELIFGRPVIFGALTVKPSQYIITMNSDEESVTVCERGSSYVAWFTTPKLLYEHMLSKIPEKFRNKSFFLHYFTISNEKIQNDLIPWNSYEAISHNHWIIRASFSQNDTQFPTAHRDNQDTSNCIMSMIFAKLYKSEDWNSTILDIILKFGERLYKKSLILQAEREAIPPNKLKLSVNQLDLPIFIRPYIINVNHKIIKRDLIVKSTDQTPLSTMKENVGEFLNSSEDGGLFIAKNYHVSIWKCPDNVFMMFDPHDVGPDGVNKKSTGFACVQRFLNHNDLVETFWHSIKSLDGPNEYQLIKISLTMDHYGDNEKFENNLDLECAVMTEVPIFPKVIRAKSMHLREERVEMTICYAIATLCVNQSLEPEFYTQDVIDRIMLLGNELTHECCTNDEICFRDFDLQKRSACPDEINWNFQLNSTFTSIQMDIFQRGFISKKSCPLPNLIFTLEDFFNFHTIGLLVTCDFITAMWKENNLYFIFYATPINEHGKIINKGSPGLISFKSVNELYNNILTNTLNEQGPFELRICSISMSDDSNDGCKEIKGKKCKREEVFPAASLQNQEKRISSKNILNINYEMVKAFKKEDRNKFLKYSLGSFMCGSISKNSKNLDERSRKHHVPAILIYCAAISSIKDPNCWCSNTIDDIILSGNGLYVESSILSRKTEVDITNVVSSIFVGNCKVFIKVEACMNIRQRDIEVEHLNSIFEALFECRNVCYIMRKSDGWLLLQNDNLIYFFDPQGIEFPGKKKSINRAIFCRFELLKNAIMQLMEGIKISDLSNNDESIQIGCITIKIEKSNDNGIYGRKSALKEKKIA